MMKGLGSPQGGRIALAVVCIVILLLGVGTFFQGNIGYRNWWGGVVFAPFAIIVGGLGLFVAGFRPKFFSGTSEEEEPYPRLAYRTGALLSQTPLVLFANRS